MSIWIQQLKVCLHLLTWTSISFLAVSHWCSCLVGGQSCCFQTCWGSWKCRRLLCAWSPAIPSLLPASHSRKLGSVGQRMTRTTGNHPWWCGMNCGEEWWKSRDLPDPFMLLDKIHCLTALSPPSVPASWLHSSALNSRSKIFFRPRDSPELHWFTCPEITASRYPLRFSMFLSLLPKCHSDSCNPSNQWFVNFRLNLR